MADAADSSFIVALTDNDPQAWVPMAEYERVYRKMTIFREFLVQHAKELNTMADKMEANDLPPDWAAPTEPMPLGDM